MFVKKTMNMKTYENGGDKWGNRFGGNGFVDNLDVKSVGLEKWKPQEGENIIDLIPFNATAGNPLVIAGKAEEGDPMYSLDYFVHKDIGPNHANITCLKQYGKDCPLCREYDRLKVLSGKDNEDKAIAMKSKRRVVYVVHDLKTGKFGYWDTGWKSVEEKITKKARVTIDPDTHAPINAFDWENGWSLKFYGEKKTFNKREYVEPDLFEFIKRPPLSDEVLAKSIDLATVIKMTSPEEMEKLISGKAYSTEPQSAPAPQSAPVVSNDEGIAKANIADYDEQPTEKKAEEAYQSAVQNTSFEQMKPVEQPVSAPQSAPASQPECQCPFGHVWGEADKHEECVKCTKLWESCFAASEV